MTEPSTRDERLEFIVCDDEATLVYVANLAAIVLHVWFSHDPTLDVPDFLLIDLDPGEGCTLATLARVALAARDELAGIGIATLVKTTGGSGLHAVVPLEPRYDWELAKGFAELVARRINAVLPADTTLLRTPRQAAARDRLPRLRPGRQGQDVRRPVQRPAARRGAGLDADRLERGRGDAPQAGPRDRARR